MKPFITFIATFFSIITAITNSVGQISSFSITENQIGPFTLQMSVAQVEQITGQTIQVQSGDQFSTDILYKGEKINVEFEKIPDGNGENYVIAFLHTNSKKFKTNEGIVVGDDLSNVQDVYLQSYIYKETPQSPEQPEYILVSKRGLKSGITFIIKDSKVLGIEVGYLPTN